MGGHTRGVRSAPCLVAAGPGYTAHSYRNGPFGLAVARVAGVAMTMTASEV